MIEAGVPALVYASSIGTYAPGPKRPVDESWPATGIPSSFYSRHKAAVERMLAELAAAHPEVRIVTLRPGLIFSAARSHPGAALEPTAHRHRRPARAAGRHPRSRRQSDRAAASSGCRPLNPNW